MNSDTTNPTWKPTLTMAKLFEEQNQFYDALAIYEIISQSDDSPQVREKIESLQSRILQDPNLKYDSRIERLFSPEELAYLKILNHSAFENLCRIRTQFLEGASDYEVVLEDDEPMVRPTVSSFEVRRMVEEIDTLAEPQETAPEAAQTVDEEPVPASEQMEPKSELEDWAERFHTATDESEPAAGEIESLPDGFQTMSEQPETLSEEPGTGSQSLIGMLEKETFEPPAETAEPAVQEPESKSGEFDSFSETIESMLKGTAEAMTKEFEPQTQYIEPPAEELESLTEEIETITEEIEKPSYETEVPLEQSEPMPEPEQEDSTITDLAAELVKHFGKESKLDSISVQEFMQVVMKHKLQEKTDKPE